MLIEIKKVTKNKAGEQVVRNVTISANDIIGIRVWSKGKEDQHIEGDMCHVTISVNNQEKRHIIAESEKSIKERLVALGVKIG